MNEKIRNPMIELLFKSILTLENIDECYSFFEDICTIHELQAMAQRLEVAFLLEKGKTYIAIGKQTGASTATISRVNRCLNYGSDGYRLILDRIKDSIEDTEGEK